MPNAGWLPRESTEFVQALASDLMLTQVGCQHRQQRLWQLIPENFGWLLIGDPRHVQYFCNFRVNPISFSADQRPLLLLTRDGKCTLLADNFTRRSAAAEVFADQEIVVPWYTHRKSVSNRDDALCTALQDVRAVWSSDAGLIEPEGVSEMVAACVTDQAGWQFHNELISGQTTLGNVIRSLRRSKHPDEVNVMRHCMHAAEAGHARAFEIIRPGISELEVYLEVQRAAQQAAGMPCVVYGDFRATNAELHKAGGLPTNYRLREQDLFILDYSVVIMGYRSDITNTIAVGEPTTAQVKQFEACHAALNAAAAMLQSGVACRQVFNEASSVLQEWGFGPLAHHAGHGLGLEHPEPPILGSESTDTLETGDVITLEPGCYLPGVGGMRFEHNYLIAEDGAEQLSQHHLGLSR